MFYELYRVVQWRFEFDGLNFLDGRFICRRLTPQDDDSNFLVHRRLLDDGRNVQVTPVSDDRLVELEDLVSDLDFSVLGRGSLGIDAHHVRTHLVPERKVTFNLLRRDMKLPPFKPL